MPLALLLAIFDGVIFSPGAKRTAGRGRGGHRVLGSGGWGESSGLRPHPLLDAPEEAHGEDHGEKLDGQYPDGKGSSQVDVGFEGVEDHRVTALLV